MRPLWLKSPVFLVTRLPAHRGRPPQSLLIAVLLLRSEPLEVRSDLEPLCRRCEHIVVGAADLCSELDGTSE